MKLGAASWVIPSPPGADPILGKLDKMAELGLSVTNVGFRDPDEANADYMKRVVDAAAEKGIELRTGAGARLGSASPEERRADVERVIKYLLAVNRYTGIRFASIANQPMSHNRWSPEPPMDERIDIIAENLAMIGDAVASAGMTICLENHCDYRGYECAEMLAKANRSNVMAQIDTGNAFTVFEEPVDCARAMARWVVSCHLKDIKVTPLLQGKSVAENAILGQGHVDNVAICGILQEEASDPSNLALMIEALALGPEDDVDQYLVRSVAWCRDALTSFLG